MDLQERRQIDLARQVERVRARVRPWRSIIALILAIGAAALAWSRGSAPLASQGSATHRVIAAAGAAVFCLLGVISAVGLSGMVRNLLQPVIGAAHAAVVRYALVLLSGLMIMVITLQLLRFPVTQLILGGAVTGVLIGIAAQQALANVFAGIVLLLARPFSVGDRVRIRSSGLFGLLEGVVTEISITYVRLETAEGVLHLPNAQVLAAAVGPAPGGMPSGAGTDAGVPAGPAHDSASQDPPVP